MSTISNTVSAKGTNTNTVTSTINLTVTEPIAKLAITKSVSSTSVLVGEPFVYTIVVNNSGSTTATSVVMEDSANKKIDFDYKQVTIDGIGSLDSSSNSNYIKVNIGDLPVATSVTITIPAVATSA
ncbi:MAG: DUF11 domain-containing protein [Clostridium sp.]|nr:DUF11 domain-containing protein [Clostridium sp.]